MASRPIRSGSQGQTDQGQCYANIVVVCKAQTTGPDVHDPLDVGLGILETSALNSSASEQWGTPMLDFQIISNATARPYYTASTS